jgi:hypothetical protein
VRHHEAWQHTHSVNPQRTGEENMTNVSSFTEPRYSTCSRHSANLEEDKSKEIYPWTTQSQTVKRQGQHLDRNQKKVVLGAHTGSLARVILSPEQFCVQLSLIFLNVDLI